MADTKARKGTSTKAPADRKQDKKAPAKQDKGSKMSPVMAAKHAITAVQTAEKHFATLNASVSDPATAEQIQALGTARHAVEVAKRTAALRIMECPVGTFATDGTMARFALEWSALVHSASAAATTHAEQVEDTWKRIAEERETARKQALQRSADEVTFVYRATKVHKIISAADLGRSWGLSRQAISNLAIAGEYAARLKVTSPSGVLFLRTARQKDSKGLSAAIEESAKDGKSPKFADVKAKVGGTSDQTKRAAARAAKAKAETESKSAPDEPVGLKASRDMVTATTALVALNKMSSHPELVTVDGVTPTQQVRGMVLALSAYARQHKLPLTFTDRQKVDLMVALGLNKARITRKEDARPIGEVIGQ